MKISNEQIRALQQEMESRRTTQARDASGFDALLTRQLDAGKAQGVAPATDTRLAAPQGGPAPLADALEGIAAAGGNAEGIVDSIAARMEGMFSGMEEYAALLASSQEGALRGAYGLLENMTGEITALRAAFPDMEAAHPELAAMVNELDVLATTETFKFNRGDYL